MTKACALPHKGNVRTPETVVLRGFLDVRCSDLLVFLPDGGEIWVHYVDPVTHDMVLADYPTAYAALPRYVPEPRQEPQKRATAQWRRK